MVNKEFVVGKYYKLRDEYPKYDMRGRTIFSFEGRETHWVSNMAPVIMDRKPRNVVTLISNNWVEFEGIEGGTWHYHPEDFEECPNHEMNKEFVVGKYYKLRADYPSLKNGVCGWCFEGRVSNWSGYKEPVINDRKPRLVLSVDGRDADGATSVVFEGIKNGAWAYYPQDFEECPNPTSSTVGNVSSIIVGAASQTGNLYDELIKNKMQNKEEPKMELTEINKQNLKEAAKQVEQERTNAEIEFAKQEYRRLVDKRDELERQITRLCIEQSEIDTKLELFTKK